MKKAAWLNEALEELDACLIDAVAEDLDKPSETGLKKAGRILKKISNHVSDQPDIYLMDEGGIAIDFWNPGGESGVLFLIAKDGSGVLFYRTQKSRGRVRVADAEYLPSEGGVQALTKAGIRSWTSR